jgi:hypothetical protein
MSTWQELQRQFEELETALPNVRLERQWTDDAEEWRLGGRYDLESAKRFRAVAADAGTLMEGLTDLPPSVRDATTENRWFRALWEMAGPHAPPVIGMMSMAGRNSSGIVSVARIPSPAALSAKLAARLGGT